MNHPDSVWIWPTSYSVEGDDIKSYEWVPHYDKVENLISGQAWSVPKGAHSVKYVPFSRLEESQRKVDTKITPSIRPLEWEEPSSKNNWIYITRSVFGEYYVSIDGGRHSAWLESNTKPYENRIGEDVGTVFEAKRFAEADYTRRISELLF